MNDFHIKSNQFREGKKTELKVPTDSAFQQISVNITLKVGF